MAASFNCITVHPILLPSDPHHRSILADLNDTIHRAEALYGSICFWSIGPDVLPGLATLLSRPDSFCVADIHLPTKIDNLHLFHKQGASLYLFFKELRPQRPDAYLQRHLLHTKMLLFDLPDGAAELWVGSHNFTKQALKGINREASLVIPCQQGDAIYTQAREYILSILHDPDCRRFDPSQIDTYKRLQGLPPDETEGGVYVLPVSWHSNELADLTQQVILLAGNDSREAAQFAALSSALSNDRAQLAVQAFDLDGGPVRKFTAVIHNQGIISPADPATYEIAFGQRRLASRFGSRMPLISARSEEHTTGALQRFRYWVSVRIGDEILDDIQFEDDIKPVQAEWKADKETTALVFSQLDNDPSEVDYRVSRGNLHNLSGRYNGPVGFEEALDDHSEQAAAARVSRWLARARQRRFRSVPPEPSVVGAFFKQAARSLPGSLASLEEQFRSDNLPALREQYEVPILEATYGDHPIEYTDLDGQKMLQVNKLLKRQVLR